MKKTIKTLLLSTFLLSVAGCASSNESGVEPSSSESEVARESSDAGESEAASASSAAASSLSPTAVDESSPLSAYSNEQIEYARVWLQLGPNQELDELNVRHIPAGEPLNPDDETSAVYPEAVIQLAGARLVDGSVTYSGNGDGTINIYNVPLRWDGQYPAGEEFYQEIIDHRETLYVQVGEDEDVITLIEKLNIQE